MIEKIRNEKCLCIYIKRIKVFSDIRELFISYSRTYFLAEQIPFLARGLIFGDDSLLSQEMKKLFRQLGLSHFTAASGSNLRLFIPDRLQSLLFFQWSFFWALCELIGIVLYLGLARFSPSLWRAAVFWAVGWIAKLFGRRAPLSILLGGVFILTFIFHKNYFGSIGFQLSLLCMIALYFSQITSDREKTMQELFNRDYFIWIREMFRDSLCIFIFLTPLLYFRFGDIVPIGVLGTLTASLPLQFFTQLSLLLMIFPHISFFDWLRQMVYSMVAGIFFCLWFVQLSVFHFFVWVIIFISIASLIVQVQREHRLWRAIQ